MAFRDGIGAVFGAVSNKIVRNTGASKQLFDSLGVVPAVTTDITAFVFVAAEVHPIVVPYRGNVVEAPGRRKLFLDSPAGGDVIAGHQSNHSFADSDLITFLGTTKGSQFLNRQNRRRPVHILADFDYATLNKTLAEEVGADGDSGASRMWSRNKNARDWRDWVSQCLILELGLGSEPSSGSPDAVRALSEDKKQVDLKGTQVVDPNDSDTINKIGKSYEMFNARMDPAVLSRLVEGYTQMYYLEDFINQAFSLNPFAKDTVHRGYLIGLWMLTHVGLLGDGDDPYTASAKKLFRRLQLKRGLGEGVAEQYSLPYGFEFHTGPRSAGSTGNRKAFRLHEPDHQQGFVKAVLESFRIVARYLRDGDFTYRDADRDADLNPISEDPNTVSSGPRVRFDSYFGNLRFANVLGDDAGSIAKRYDIRDDIYSKAFYIRRSILDAVYLRKESRNLAHIKRSASINGGVLYSFNEDEPQDDIERIMFRMLRMDRDNLVTISPYLISDFVGMGEQGEINHFLTMPDNFRLKKVKALELFNAYADGEPEATVNELKDDLRRFTFSQGPTSLSALCDTLIKQFCPISTTDSLDRKRGLVLLDHRNIVSHLSRGLVGQTITDASLEKVHRTANRAGTSTKFYKFKILNAAQVSMVNARGRVSWDIYGNAVDDSREALQVSELNTRGPNENTTSVFGGLLGEKRSTSKEMISLLNCTFTKALPSELRRQYIFWCVLLQLSDASNTPGVPFFMNAGVTNSERMKGRKLPGVADALHEEYRARVNSPSSRLFLQYRGNKVADFFAKADMTPPVSFSTATLSEKQKVNDFLLEEMRTNVFTSSSGPLQGAFDDVMSLHDKINELPRTMENAYDSYRDLIFDLLRRVSRVPNEQDERQLATNAALLFGQNVPEGMDNWSLVIQDFVNPRGRYQAGARDDNWQHRGNTAIASSYTYQRRRRVGRGPRREDSISFETENGRVVGVQGATGGGQRGGAGFATAIVSDARGNTTRNLVESAMGGLQEHILGFDRNKNILIMLSENICAQLFFGFPPDTSGEMFTPQFLTSYERNEDGILRYLGLIDEEGRIALTQEELFDIVWEYCVIADQMISQLPGVKLKFEFARATYRDGSLHSSYFNEEFLELDDVYYLQRANMWNQRFSNAIVSARRRMDQYLPPSVTEIIPTSKGQTDARNRAMAMFGAQSHEEAAQRRENLIRDVFTAAERISAFFVFAEKELAKEPEFALRFRKETGDSGVPFTQLAKNMRLGFLDHVAFDSDFSRHAMKFMKNANPNGHARNDPTRAPHLLAPAAIEKYVGLTTSQHPMELDSSRAFFQITPGSSSNFTFSMIGAELESDSNIVPYARRARVLYHPDYTLNDRNGPSSSVPLDRAYAERYYGATTQPATYSYSYDDAELAFTSLPLMPHHCFGFVYNLKVTQANTTSIDGQMFNSNFRVNNDNMGVNRQPRFNDDGTMKDSLNQFEGRYVEFEEQPLNAGFTRTVGEGFNRLNDHYMQHLALTPPAIYMKMLEKIGLLTRKIEEVKRTSTARDFNRSVDRLSFSNPEFNIIRLQEPVAKKRRKIVIEFEVLKETYQFVKAFKPGANLIIGHDYYENANPPVVTVAPYDTGNGFSSTRQVLQRLTSFVAACIDDNTISTIKQRRDHRNSGGLDQRTVTGLSPVSRPLNSLGRHLNSYGLGPIRAVGQPPQPDVTYKQWNYQFTMLCWSVGKFNFGETDIHRFDDVEIDGSGTLHEQVTPEGIPTNVFLTDVKQRALGYALGTVNSGYISQELVDFWQTNTEYPTRSPYATYFMPVDKGASSIRLLRADKDHRATGDSLKNFFASDVPNTPTKVIFASSRLGKEFHFGPAEYALTEANRDDYAIIPPNQYNPEYPELFSVNKLKNSVKQTDNPKIRIELYLAKTDGQYTHFSKEPIYVDEPDHPTAQPLSGILDGTVRSAFKTILIRPTYVATLQFNFPSEQGPRFYGPEVPGSPQSTFDTLEHDNPYPVNDTLPFFVSIPWGELLSRQIQNIGFRNNLNDVDTSATSMIQTYELLGTTQEELTRYFRTKLDEVSRATQPYAISYLNQMRNGIEQYITNNLENLNRAQQVYLRQMLYDIPYFFDFTTQFPAVNVTFTSSDEDEVQPPDVYVDINWDLIKRDAVGGRNEGGNQRTNNLFSAGFMNDRTQEVYRLERQFLDFLYATKDYAEMTQDAYSFGMSMYDDTMKKMTDVGSFEMDGSLLPTNRDAVINEIRAFVQGNGIDGVTPDTISSLDAILRLHIEQYNDSDPIVASNDVTDGARDNRRKSLGLEIAPGVLVQTPFKLSPFDINAPAQLMSKNTTRESGRIKKYTKEVDNWKNIERRLSYPDGEKVFHDSTTRVCFVGIESGELHRMINAPLNNYGELSSAGTTAITTYLSSGDINTGTNEQIARNSKFKVELEVFDFFRPWLKFVSKRIMIFSREKPYRIMTVGQEVVGAPSGFEPDFERSNLRTSALENIMTQSVYVPPDINDMQPHSSRYKFDDSSSYDIFDVFLKTYASRVMGLDFFEFMIPRLGTIPPIADYVPDSSNSSGMLPEERNYQEYMNEYTKKLFKELRLAIDDAGNLERGRVDHIIKYFLDRKNMKEIAGGPDLIQHFDSVGRTALISGNRGIPFGLLDTDAVEGLDTEDAKLYPFRFTKPVTKKSLQAAEIITGVNEYSTNTMREFRDGFLFDRIVGIPYKLSDFQLSRYCRDNLNGEPINIQHLLADGRAFEAEGRLRLSEAYYETLLANLSYLDKDNPGTVMDNSLYPLTIRASVCKVEG